MQTETEIPRKAEGEFNDEATQAAVRAVWPDEPSGATTACVSPLAAATFPSGPRYIAIYMLALPVIVVALASSGRQQLVSGLIAASWLVLAPMALYSRRAALVLPFVSALFVAVATQVFDFNSAAFVVDVTAAVLMFLVSFPRQRAARPRMQPLAVNR